jgi:phospholipid/cholesterol/gamma-HCH transport system substrate-binding protein
MASQGTKFSVGLFMAGGTTLAILALIWLGMSRYLEKGQFYVTYFNESVQGLGIDSPVKYRGVSIGRVKKIGVAPDSRLIEVVLAVESGQSLEKDIVAQLTPVGITGSMFIELDLKEKDEPDLSPSLSFPTRYPILASKPSDISHLLQGIDDVVGQIRSMDLKSVSLKVQATLDTVNQSIIDANVKGVATNIEHSVAGLRQIINNEKWNEILTAVANVGQAAHALMARADGSLSSLGGTLARIEKMVVENQDTIGATIKEIQKATQSANLLLEQGTTLLVGSNDTVNQFRRHLLMTLDNMERTSETMNALVEALSEQPSQLLFGKAPRPREIEAKEARAKR